VFVLTKQYRGSQRTKGCARLVGEGRKPVGQYISVDESKVALSAGSLPDNGYRLSDVTRAFAMTK